MILQLLKGWLRAPSVEEKEGGGRTMKTTTCGTPHGGVISPLLANLYLHPLDGEINGQTSAKARMVRYADDLVIGGPAGQGASLQERLTQWLTAKGLTLNERKTRIVQSRASSFVFLGFAFRWQQSRHGKEYVHVCPSPAAEEALREKIRGMTHHATTWKDPAELVGEINQVTRGWAQYFAASHHARSFRQRSHFVAERMRRWLRHKHHTDGRYERWPDEVLQGTYGLERLHDVWTQPSGTSMELGKPDAGKPPVRFDEGREAGGHWPRPRNPSLPAYSTRDCLKTRFQMAEGPRQASPATVFSCQGKFWDF
jgi:RNA-directed DNA polymerase